MADLWTNVRHVDCDFWLVLLTITCKVVIVSVIVEVSLKWVLNAIMHNTVAYPYNTSTLPCIRLNSCSEKKEPGQLNFEGSLMSVLLVQWLTPLQKPLSNDNILKQSDGRWVQFVSRTAFHSNHSERFWHILMAEMDLCHIRAFSQRKVFLFWQPSPKSNSLCLAPSALCKSCLFSLWVRYLIKKKGSDRAHRVVHSLPCSMFNASLCTIQTRNSATILILLVIDNLWWRHHASDYRHFSMG